MKPITLTEILKTVTVILVLTVGIYALHHIEEAYYERQIANAIRQTQHEMVTKFFITNHAFLGPFDVRGTTNCVFSNILIMNVEPNEPLIILDK